MRIPWPPGTPDLHSTMRLPRGYATRNAPGRNRTCDLALRRRALYPLSYRRSGAKSSGGVSGVTGDGLRLRRPSDALGKPPLEAQARRLAASDADRRRRSARPRAGASRAARRRPQARGSSPRSRTSRSARSSARAGVQARGRPRAAPGSGPAASRRPRRPSSPVMKTSAADVAVQQPCRRRARSARRRAQEHVHQRERDHAPPALEAPSRPAAGSGRSSSVFASQMNADPALAHAGVVLGEGREQARRPRSRPPRRARSGPVSARKFRSRRTAR